MDASSSINNNNKSQKHHEGHGKGESIMKLCDLHDEILQKILSSLPTKEAVATSVLSKRWVDQWMGINEIDLKLDEGAPEKRQHFIDFVDRLLMVCKNRSSLKKLSLLFEVGKDFPRVNKWLSVFINPMIEELHLELERVEKPLVLPHQFFTSEKLTKFQLSMRQVIEIPSTVNFKNLVTLTLKHVIFPNSYCTQEFFIGLPSLKELTLIDCNWKKVGSLTIVCELLQRLFIKESTDEDDDHNNDIEGEEEDIEKKNGVYDLQDTNQDQNYDHGEIGFLAPKLLTFSYVGDLINDYSLFYTASAIDAHIEIYPEEENNPVHSGYFVYKLLVALLNVKKLSICDFSLETLFQAHFSAENLPTFYHLVVLRVISSTTMNLSCQGLQTILQHSPVLEEIEFDVKHMTTAVTLAENGENAINPLPACFGTHLKIIKIYGFCGFEGELNAIKFLLQTAQVLDTLYLCIDEYAFDSLWEERLERLYEHILGYPKASLDCDINLDIDRRDC